MAGARLCAAWSYRVPTTSQAIGKWLLKQAASAMLQMKGCMPECARVAMGAACSDSIKGYKIVRLRVSFRSA